MTTRLGTRLPAVLAAMSVLACGGGSEKAPPPAVVRNAVAEGELTTVTLTADAVRRLGIRTAAVESLTVSPTRTVGGEIVVPPGHSVTIGAPAAGTVLATEDGVVPTAGMRVSKGAELMRLAPIQSDPGQAARDQAVADANVRRALAESTRTSRLFEDRLVSSRDFEMATAELASARATAAAATAQLSLARGGPAQPALTTLRVSSPTDGILRGLHVAPGQTVPAGAPLADVMRTDRMWVRVPLYAGDAERVRRSAPASVHGLGAASWGPGLSASPIAAPPSADAAAASVDLFYELRDPPGTLRPGERVGVTLTLATESGRRELAVPVAALVRDFAGGSWVYERRDSVTFVRRRVDVTRVAGRYAMLGAGPHAGTIVVTDGAAELFGTEFGAGK